MANFTTHLGGGLVLALGLSGATVTLLAPGHGGLAASVALTTIIGSLMPDLDSDTSIPFHVAFSLLAALAAAGAAVFAVMVWPGNWERLFVAPFATLLFTWGVLGPVVRKFTVHRGMAHSLPAALLAGAVLFSVGTRLGIVPWDAFLLGTGLSFGYVLHLVLDELFAAVNFHGHLFIPNKALGSALKLFSDSRSMNVAVYAALLMLVLSNIQELVPFSIQLYRIATVAVLEGT